MVICAEHRPPYVTPWVCIDDVEEQHVEQKHMSRFKTLTLLHKGFLDEIMFVGCLKHKFSAQSLKHMHKDTSMGVVNRR